MIIKLIVAKTLTLFVLGKIGLTTWHNTVVTYGRSGLTPVSMEAIAERAEESW